MTTVGWEGTDWRAIRAQFPAIGESVYLNTAGGAPLAESIAAEGIRFYEEIRDIGDKMWDQWLQRVEDARQSIASFVNATPHSIAFVANSSLAMNMVVGYLTTDGVTEVVTMADSFPSITVPLAHHGTRVRMVESMPDGSVTVDMVASTLTDRTGALIVSAVEYGTGYHHDLYALRDLCEERGLAFVIDGTQSLGATKFDLADLRPDFFMASTYKWLVGGYGLSVFYIAPKWHAKQPPVAGWMSAEEAHGLDIELKKNAQVMETGCPNFPAIFTLGASIEFLHRLGMDNVVARVRHLVSYLIAALDEAGIEVASTREPARQSSIVSVRLSDPTGVAQQLQERGIFVSAKGLGLRVSVYIYNSEEDIDRLVAALKELV